MGKKTRGRLKIKMEYIVDKLKRYTTFSKRRSGIMKKAYELHTLTGTEVLLLVASETGHVYTYATDRLKPVFTSDMGRHLIQQCLGADASATVTSEGSSRIHQTNHPNLMINEQSNNQESDDDDDDDDDDDSNLDNEEELVALNNSSPSSSIQQQQRQIIAPQIQPPAPQRKQTQTARTTRKTGTAAIIRNDSRDQVKVEPIFGSSSTTQIQTQTTPLVLESDEPPSAKQRRASFQPSQMATTPSPSSSLLNSPGALLAAANGHLYFVNSNTSSQPDGSGIMASVLQRSNSSVGRRVSPPGGASFMQHNGHHLVASSTDPQTGISVYEQDLFISAVNSQPSSHLSRSNHHPQLPSQSSVSSSASDNNNHQSISSSRTFSKQ